MEILSGHISPIVWESTGDLWIYSTRVCNTDRYGLFVFNVDMFWTKGQVAG